MQLIYSMNSLVDVNSNIMLKEEGQQTYIIKKVGVTDEKVYKAKIL